ncbi:Uncharacterised protein [Salmonella enterica subsp. enterica]|uniref:Uncharacterized protein n=1 Tax=Salmonella enterica I TaxID=59201 RepID=A0A379WWU0_SALET|nr:Uncharacterised protein [Salmonella enterica subsp. enterica]
MTYPTKKRFIFTVLMHTHRGHPQIIGVMNIFGIPTAYALSPDKHWERYLLRRFHLCGRELRVGIVMPVMRECMFYGLPGLVIKLLDLSVSKRYCRKAMSFFCR